MVLFDSSFLGPKGPLAKLETYEDRPMQREMADFVYEVLREGHIGAIEAGTGTGKSLAYLYPALCYARAHKEKVVISTNTINLQEQLMEKDVPFLQSLDLDFRAVVVRGWSNYPCLLRVEDVLAFEVGENEAWLLNFKEQILGRRIETRSDVTLPEGIRWDELAAESDLCQRQQCPYMEPCPIFIRRRQEEKADLLIVNHHVLLADVSVRKETGWDERAVLPAYSHVIFDEAHHLETVATDYFGVQMSMMRLLRFMGLFYRLQGRKPRGLLPSLQEKIVGEPLAVKKRDQLIHQIEGELLPTLRSMRDHGTRLFSALANKTSGEPTRLVSAHALEEASLMQEYHNLHTAFSDFVSHLADLVVALEELGEDVLPRLIPQTGLRPFLKRAENIVEELEFLFAVGRKDYVYWVESVGKTKQAAILAAPIEIGPSLRDELVFKLDSVIFTSATLTVKEDFSFFLQSLGISPAEWKDVATRIIASPFDYQTQAFVGIPENAPYPDEKSFLPFLIQSLPGLVDSTRGRIFVLFTSYTMLENTVRAVRDELTGTGFDLYVQGEMPRNLMLQGFLHSSKGVLFGTDSFWEGVDVPGENLCCVVLVKLPFRVPKDPIVEARALRIEELGGNSFRDFFLPQAVIKFRQGFGRLIRRRGDKGVVLVYDRRLLDKSYGKSFLESLPPIGVKRGALHHLISEVEQWLS